MARVCKVLVVEGNDDVRELFKEMLSDEGYRLLTARDAEEMRRLVATQSDIDVLVIDLTWLGADDGLALAREIAAQGQAVLLVSGDHRLVERMESSGHRYLLKPFRLASLLDLVARVLHEVANDCTRAARRA